MRGDPAPIVELENVSVAYDGVLALSDVSFTVHRGEYVAVLGPNGSGKSTLIRAILGLIRPSRGRVRLFGTPPWELSFRERERIGYVAQESWVHPQFPITVYDVVLMGRYAHLGLFKRPGREDQRAVEQALVRVGIAELAGRRIGQLSGGQRQRALIARALATEPELLILDEPTTSLDVQMTEGLYELIDELHLELRLTVIVVSHDVGVVTRWADTIACLAGRLVAHGRPGEVLTPGTLECMYGQDATVFGHSVVPHLLVPRHDEETEGGENAGG